ncbi:AraC family transcriptional regulator [Undibacterium sp. TS12]|uniref:AraC family transcriptional regulator n=1 Tax=Undibacterium sp. TS12 TaxID=2908202 RepID=UPI001F4D1BE1|nr:AraC family transcriptional regulator [Undibacterium sp. TS12]MCH8618689.1 AraC family transcriptional regulator [Undibacterium sp. TS12]
MPKPSLTNSSFSNARVAAAYLQPLLDLARARKLNLDELAHQAGMAENMLTAVPDTIAATDYLRLLDAGAELCQDAQFGLHVGERIKLGAYNVYGMILMSCRDFAQAFQQTMRYEGLAHDLGRSELRVEGDIAEYQWHNHFPQASRHLVDSVFAGIRVFGNWFAGATLPHAPVYFMHAAPAELSEYHRIFGPEVHFDAPINCARFPTALLSWQVPNADVSMYPVLQQHAEQMLLQKQRAHSDGNIVVQVRAAISNALAQDRARLPLIAQDLLLSQRTLQRKLSDIGISFQQILDQTRKELAQDYLRQADLNLADIAFLLGYREQSAFNHAFKDWTGLSPGAYRERYRQQNLTRK